MPSISLKKFDMSNITPGKTILMVARRNSGKTVLITDLMHALKKDIPVAVVCSGTESGCEYFSKFVPPVMVHGTYSEDILKRMLVRQKKIMKKKRDAPPHEAKLINPNVLCVLDDCAFDKTMFKSPTYRYLMMNGRHVASTMVTSAQYAMDVTPDIRSQIDFVFVLREPIRANKEKLYKNFFGIFPDFDTFTQVLDSVCENYGCLVLDNSSRSSKIEDCVYWYRAPLREENWRFGHPSFWKAAVERFNPNYEDEQLSDLVHGTKTKKKPVLEVKKEM